MTLALKTVEQENRERGPLMIVRRAVAETEDARTFELEVPAELAHLYKGRAGQFLRIRIPGDPEQLSRCYSLSSSPELGEPARFTVKRVPSGAVSERLVTQFAIGQRLHVEPPAGAFTLKDAGLPLLLIAGGSGITPVFSLLKTALSTSDRPIALLYANRNRPATIFAAEIDYYARAYPERLTVRVHYSDDEGFLDDTLVRSFVSVYPGSQVYLCGPQPLMDIVERALSEPALAAAHELICEKFSSPAPGGAIEKAPEGSSVVGSVKVVMRLDGAEHAFTWSGTVSLLDAALDADVPAPHSCREGHCGACKAKLIEGKVGQSAAAIALSKRDRDRGNVLACCATPQSESIVLDYD